MNEVRAEEKLCVDAVRKDAFVGKHYRRVFSAVASCVERYFGIDAGEAEDIAAEAAERSLGYLAKQKGVEAWRMEDWRALALWKGRRLALDAYRRAKNRPQLTLDVAVPGQDEHGTPAEPMLVSAASLEQWRGDCARADAQARVRVSFNGLFQLFLRAGLKNPRRDYEVLEAIYRNGEDRRRVCCRYGVSLDYSYVLLHRIRKAAGRLGRSALGAYDPAA